MYKELIISIAIVVAILGLNNITQKYTAESIDTMKEELTLVRDEITKEEVDADKTHENMKKVSENWQGRHDKLAYYIEHDELEKVETHLTMLESNIEVEDYDQALAELDSCSFVLEHIKDKESLKIRNIF